MITSIISLPPCIEEREIAEGNRFDSYKYLGTAIRIHDIMLGTKDELGRGALVKCAFTCSRQQSFDVFLCLLSHFTMG